MLVGGRPFERRDVLRVRGDQTVHRRAVVARPADEEVAVVSGEHRRRGVVVPGDVRFDDGGLEQSGVVVVDADTDVPPGRSPDVADVRPVVVADVTDCTRVREPDPPGVPSVDPVVFLQ